jgi:glycosyltransferase involved in cell wall biosynthesis
MRFSVVIPTWNEARWLPRLLSCLLKWPDLGEIIVADSNSSDETTTIAKRYGCRIVQGGRPAEGRNAGSKASNGDVILFADADAVVPQSTLAHIAESFRRSSIVGLHCRLVPLGASAFVAFSYRVMDAYLRVLSMRGISQGVGTLIAVRRDAFKAVNGFREDILVGEDADFIRRLGRIGDVRYERRVVVYTSARRFSLENQYLFAAKTVLWTIIRLFGLSSSIIPYRWRVYPAALADVDAEALAKVLGEESPEATVLVTQD